MRSPPRESRQVHGPRVLGATGGAHAGSRGVGGPPRRTHRTRRANFPLTWMPIFLAISDRGWSTMITYPCQSFEVSFPHSGHLSSSVMWEQFLHAFGIFTTIVSAPLLLAAPLRAGAVLLDPVDLHQ